MADTGGRSNPFPKVTRPSSGSGASTPPASASQQLPTASSSETRWRPQAMQTEYGSITSPASRPQQGTDSPERTTPKAKKPPTARRATSSYVPKKGQEFSVDDAQDEVVQDLTEQQQQQLDRKQPPRPTPTQTQSLRRKPSTVRRRTAQPPALTTVDSHDDDNDDEAEGREAPAPHPALDGQPSPPSDETVAAGEEEEEEEEDSGHGGEDDEDDDDGDISDAESFTLKDRQEAINVTHPFGIRIWKPALYKKDRSVQRNAQDDIHSSPGLFVSNWLVLFNIAWTLVFGWWLALIAAAGSLVCALFGIAQLGSCVDYAWLLFHLAKYMFYPFGKYVKLMQDEAYLEEDEGEGRSISEYEQWQSGDIEEGRLFFGPADNNGSGSLIGRRRNSVDSTDETTSLLGREGRGNIAHSDTAKTKTRLFGRGKWSVGRVIFFIFFYGVFTPALFLVSALCWFMVWTIPMGKVTLLLFDHLRRHPLALSFHSDSGNVRRPGEASSILLCTYRAVGMKYWKYTIDGTNIFLINLLGLVAFVIFDYWVLDVALGLQLWITDKFFIFTFALASIIPLAYFIGQAVASISAQSSMGVGATINAFFSTIVEVFLYCVALKKGKAQLVEGSIIGSIFAGILFLPGLSMCFGALKRKTQRFNVKSAGVTSTMLLFAVLGAFGPTLFYQIYGSHELICSECTPLNSASEDPDCRRCYYSQIPAISDRFYTEAVRPYTWFAASLLILSYVIGMLFTLRTHAAVIWSNDIEEKKASEVSGSHLGGSEHTEHHIHHHQVHHTLSRQATSSSVAKTDIRNSQLYKRIVGQSYQEVGLGPNGEAPEPREPRSQSDSQTPHHLVPPRDADTHAGYQFQGLSDAESQTLVRQVTEIAATTSAIATRDATKSPHKTAHLANTPIRKNADRPHHKRTGTTGTLAGTVIEEEVPPGHTSGGHDAPNWSRTKSAVILCVATLAYAVIAEILVGTVDAVLEGSDIDEKFLGITLFALVPNTTEFLNAISFAMNGNIALSMEIGSAYALQVLLLQIPAVVFYSAVYGQYISESQILDHTFTMIFPQWDMVTVILCVFLLSYMYGEGKSNYFKGSILILSYFVVIVGFYLSSFNEFDMKGVNPRDTLAVGRLVEQHIGSNDRIY